MKKILIVVGIVLVVLIAVVLLFLGNIVKTGIETAGPKIAGVPMTVEKVGINPLSGSVNVKALVIGNPEGFKTDSCMELGEFKLDIDMGSLFTDTIVIKRIRIDAPEITYERGLKASDIIRIFLKRTERRSVNISSPCSKFSLKEIGPICRQASETSEVSSATPNMPLRPPFSGTVK